MAARRHYGSHDEGEDLVRLYLADAGRHALLTKADEERLGHQVELGQRRVWKKWPRSGESP